MVHEKPHTANVHPFIKQSLRETLPEQRTRAPFLAQGLALSQIQVPKNKWSHNSCCLQLAAGAIYRITGTHCLKKPKSGLPPSCPELSKIKMFLPTNQPAAWVNYEEEKSTLSSACGTIIIPCMLLQKRCCYQKHHACKITLLGMVPDWRGSWLSLSLWKTNLPRCLFCCCLPQREPGPRLTHTKRTCGDTKPGAVSIPKVN